MTDLLTAFRQRLAGQDSAQNPVSTTIAKAPLRVAEPNAAAQPPPGEGDLVKLPSALTREQTSTIDNARRLLQVGIDEILLSGLARVAAAVMGQGVVTVSLTGAGRSVLDPEVDVRRTVGWFSTIYPIALPCVDLPEAGAMQLLEQMRQTVNAVPHYGIGYDIGHYLRTPTARLQEASGAPAIHFVNLEMISEDDERVLSCSPPRLGHPIELRVYRRGAALHIDCWYDRRRVRGGMIEALAEPFHAILLGLVGEAVAEHVGEHG